MNEFPQEPNVVQNDTLHTSMPQELQGRASEPVSVAVEQGRSHHLRTAVALAAACAALGSSVIEAGAANAAPVTSEAKAQPVSTSGVAQLAPTRLVAATHRALPCEAWTKSPAVRRKAQLAIRKAARRTITNAGIAPGATISVGCGDHAVAIATVGTTGERGRAVSVPSTMYDAASVTKPMTATAITMLSQEGKLKLSDKVGKYLPQYRHGAKANVTVKQLMEHRSGLPDPSYRTFIRSAKTPSETLSRVLNYPLRYSPGSKFVYSNIGYATLYAVGSKAAHESLANYEKRKIWKPLGMNHTGYAPSAKNCPPTSPDVEDGLSMKLVYRCIPQDWLARKLGNKAGHAGVFYSTADLGKFAAMLANGGKINGHSYLTPASIKVLKTNRGANYGAGMRTNGSHKYSNRMSRLAFGHTGWNGGSMFVDPTTGAWYAIGMNGTYKRPAPIQKSYVAARAVSDAYLNAVHP